MTSEPVFITSHDFGPYRHGNRVDRGGQYMIFYYVGQIPADAVGPYPSLPTENSLCGY
jgi:hypothetical protein